MHPLEIYYLNQMARGITHSGEIGPVYIVPLYLHRGHEIGNIFGSLFRLGPTHTVARAKAVGPETLRTGGKILTNIAEI